MQHRGSDIGRGRRILVTWCLAAASAATGCAIAGVATAQAGATATSDLSFTVTPTTNLTDAEAMTVTVDRTAPGTTAGLEIIKVVPAWCAPGTRLPTSVPTGSYGTTGGFPPGLGKTVICTTNTHPLNGDSLPISVISPLVKRTGNYTSVTGTTIAQATQGVTLRNGSVACDATYPCTFAMAVYVRIRTPHNATQLIFFLQTPVTYAATAVATDCGGPATTVVTTAGPDRLGKMLTDTTIAGCVAKAGGGKELAEVNTSGGSDGKALCQFASGAADLAYSAVGYGTPSSAFSPSACAGTTGGPQPARPYVAVPIALDAVDLAHTQTISQATVSHTVSFAMYQHFDLTVQEAAQLVGATGNGLWEFPLGKALVKLDPTLTGDFFYAPTRPINHNNIAVVGGPVVTSGSQATTYFFTSYLHTLVPTSVVSPTSGNPRLGPIANFGLAAPQYAVDPTTGLVNIVKALTPTRSFGGEPFAVLPTADSVSVWFGMTNVALQTPTSVGLSKVLYVSPTTATMQAAVPGMAKEADGTLRPNADSTIPTAYPLTYVEYALAPTQPLEGAGCVPRTMAEQNLVNWLTFLTGPGQSALPAGMAPLTSTLETRAAAAIAKIGTAAPGCTPPVASTTTQPSSGSSSTGSSTATTSSTTSIVGTPPGTPELAGGATFGGASAIGSPSSATPTAAAGGTPISTSAPGGNKGSGGSPRGISLAGFRTVVATDWLLPTAGVLFLIALVPGMALLASGRAAGASPAAAAAGFARMARRARLRRWRRR